MNLDKSRSLGSSSLKTHDMRCHTSVLSCGNVYSQSLCILIVLIQDFRCLLDILLTLFIWDACFTILWIAWWQHWQLCRSMLDQLELLKRLVGHGTMITARNVTVYIPVPIPTCHHGLVSSLVISTAAGSCQGFPKACNRIVHGTKSIHSYLWLVIWYSQPYNRLLLLVQVWTSSGLIEASSSSCFLLNPNVSQKTTWKWKQKHLT